MILLLGPLLVFGLIWGHLAFAQHLIILENSGNYQQQFDLVKDISPEGDSLVGSTTAADGFPQPARWHWNGSGYQVQVMDHLASRGMILAADSHSFGLARMSPQGGLPEMLYRSHHDQRLVSRRIGAAGQARLTAISRLNGPKLIGVRNSQAIVWTLEAGEQNLPVLDQAANRSEAIAITSQGETIVGNVSGTGFQKLMLWKFTGDQIIAQELPHFDPSLPFASATGVSDDGRIVVGTVMTSRGLRAAIWSDGAAPSLLPAPKGTRFAIATAVSADGSSVIGYFQYQDNKDIEQERSFVWSASTGVRLVEQLLEDPKDRKSFHSWTRVRAEHISANGRVLVGDATIPNMGRQLWVIRL